MVPPIHFRRRDFQRWTITEPATLSDLIQPLKLFLNSSLAMRSLARHRVWGTMFRKAWSVTLKTSFSNKQKPDSDSVGEHLIWAAFHNYIEYMHNASNTMKPSPLYCQLKKWEVSKRAEAVHQSLAWNDCVDYQIPTHSACSKLVQFFLQTSVDAFYGTGSRFLAIAECSVRGTLIVATEFLLRCRQSSHLGMVVGLYF